MPWENSEHHRVQLYWERKVHRVASTKVHAQLMTMEVLLVHMQGKKNQTARTSCKSEEYIILHCSEVALEGHTVQHLIVLALL